MREREMPLEEIQTLSNRADESGRGNVTWPGWSEEIMLIKGNTSLVPTRRARTSPSILTCRNPSSTFLALEPRLGTSGAKKFFLLKMQGSIKAVVSKLDLNSRPCSQPSLDNLLHQNKRKKEEVSCLDKKKNCNSDCRDFKIAPTWNKEHHRF